MLTGVALGLDLKFGRAGDALLPEVRAITDTAMPNAIIERIKAATTPDEVRAVYAPGE